MGKTGVGRGTYAKIPLWTFNHTDMLLFYDLISTMSKILSFLPKRIYEIRVLHGLFYYFMVNTDIAILIISPA